MVLGECDAFGREDESVAAVAVGLGEGAVNGDGVAAALDRLLALLDLNGDVAVDDQRVPLDAEFGCYARAELRVLYQLEVRVLGLLVRRLVPDEVGLEGRHAVFAEERRARARPEVPEPVGLAVRVLGAPAEAPAHHEVERVEELS